MSSSTLFCPFLLPAGLKQPRTPVDPASRPDPNSLAAAFADITHAEPQQLLVHLFKPPPQQHGTVVRSPWAALAYQLHLSPKVLDVEIQKFLAQVQAEAAEEAAGQGLGLRRQGAPEDSKALQSYISTPKARHY
jgi:hypothetical protein